MPPGPNIRRKGRASIQDGGVRLPPMPAPRFQRWSAARSSREVYPRVTRAHWPAQAEMTTALGVCGKTDEQNFVVGTVWRDGLELRPAITAVSGLTATREPPTHETSPAQGTDAGSSRWSNKLVALSEVLSGCQNQPVKNAMQLAAQPKAPRPCPNTRQRATPNAPRQLA